ncbi:precorrin-6A synthase (deacetylating) [Vreelandella sp. EE27]
MISLSLIGIGTGNPDHVTLAAVRALNAADAVFLPRKGDAKADLIDLRRLLCDELLESGSATNIIEFDLPTRDGQAPYLGAVNDWHAAIAAAWAKLLDEHLPNGGQAAMLVWGDPSLYDSSLRIAKRLQDGGREVNVSVIPGITSLQVLTAEHKIPLNALAASIHITTGRRLRDHGWPEGAATVAVMLDSGGAFTAIDQQDTYIWWGAYLGMEKQCLIEGRLLEVSEQIIERRAELRAIHGWIMDCYLLAREPLL